MKTQAEREADFRKDFAELLKKHKADFDITDDGKSYGMHTPIVIVTMYTEFENDTIVKEFCEFTL